MPRASKQAECASPSRPQRSGSKQLAENLSKDELLKRLKVSNILVTDLRLLLLQVFHCEITSA